MKAFTDLEQSKKLAEILPLESADMAYIASADDDDGEPLYTAVYKSEIIIQEDDEDIPCWSLAALLSVLPNPTLTQYSEDKWNIAVFDKKDNHFKDECFADEPVDACYEMIVRLHLNKEDKQ